MHQRFKSDVSVAQSWRGGRDAREKRPAPPLDRVGLERLALRYVERYATTRAKLADYLRRKLRERGWEGEADPTIESLVERLADLGYVDDAGFAISRASSLTRRGYGPRRVALSLRAAGIRDDDLEDASKIAGDQAWDAALAFARRKRIGPFAAAPHDRPAREKALAALLRAGHGIDMARRIVAAEPGTIPEWHEG
jgi:regulatory protein